MTICPCDIGELDLTIMPGKLIIDFSLSYFCYNFHLCVIKLKLGLHFFTQTYIYPHIYVILASKTTIAGKAKNRFLYALLLCLSDALLTGDLDKSRVKRDQSVKMQTEKTRCTMW